MSNPPSSYIYIYKLLSYSVAKKFLFFLHEGLLGWGRSDLEISDNRVEILVSNAFYILHWCLLVTTLYQCQFLVVIAQPTANEKGDYAFGHKILIESSKSDSIICS